MDLQRCKPNMNPSSFEDRPHTPTPFVTTQWSMTVNKAAPTLLAPTALNFKAGLTASLSTVQVADADSSILTMTIDASKGKLS